MIKYVADSLHCKFDLSTTLKLYLRIFCFYRFLLVEYGHLLKINRGNTVYVCQSPSQERKADVYARRDYKIMPVFFQQADQASKDIPLESSILFQGGCHRSSTLWHLFWKGLQSPFVWATWKKNKPLHPTSLLTEKSYYPV